MKFNIFDNRCLKVKTRLQSLEREIAISIQFIRCIENQNWEVLKNDHQNEESRLLESLQKMGEKLAEYFTKEKDQIWIGEGVEKISAVLRQNPNDLDLLTGDVLHEIVKRVRACNGAIFVPKESPGNKLVLEMRASYAVAKKKNESTEIEPGQGLVGQCFLEGEYIYMTDVPKGYISVISGLGEAPPRCILLLPLKSKDQTIGVLELASFAPITPVQFHFLKEVSESIAGAILTGKEREKTEKLLEQSKLMTLELTKREEELRQTLEEMQTIREDQLNKQADLENAYAKIIEKNKEIEKIQIRETELIETKLKTHQEITDKVINKLKSKIVELQKKMEFMHPIASSSLLN